jgi:hypothetical protein
VSSEETATIPREVKPHSQVTGRGSSHARVVIILTAPFGSLHRLSLSMHNDTMSMCVTRSVPKYLACPHCAALIHSAKHSLKGGAICHVISRMDGHYERPACITAWMGNRSSTSTLTLLKPSLMATTDNKRVSCTVITSWWCHLIVSAADNCLYIK